MLGPVLLDSLDTFKLPFPYYGEDEFTIFPNICSSEKSSLFSILAKLYLKFNLTDTCMTFTGDGGCTFKIFGRK